jgi:hypothetical protein
MIVISGDETAHDQTATIGVDSSKATELNREGPLVALGGMTVASDGAAGDLRGASTRCWLTCNMIGLRGRGTADPSLSRQTPSSRIQPEKRPPSQWEEMQQGEHIPLDIEPNTKQESMLVCMLIHSRTRYDGVLGDTCMTGHEEDTTPVINFYPYDRGEVTADRAEVCNRKGVHLGDLFFSADLLCPFGRLDFQQAMQRRGM